jgi:CYTH domain-containing protein
MRPIDGGPGMLKLTRKGDVDAFTRLITSIYLPEEEFAILSACLVGARLSKLRHRLHTPAGISMSVDEFQGALAGLRLLEVEFETTAELVAFTAPDFAAAEVTSDPRYTGASLAKNGLPV